MEASVVNTVTDESEVKAAVVVVETGLLVEGMVVDDEAKGDEGREVDEAKLDDDMDDCTKGVDGTEQDETNAVCGAV